MSDALSEFSTLTPDLVLEMIERALGVRVSNLCRSLTSYINRVYEVQLDDGTWVVAKFYRPGRWSPAALQDEQDFVTELAAAEIPVVPPLAGPRGATLHAHDGLYFAVFPKRGGRPCDEFSPEQWISFGRLMGRVHNVGADRAPRDRIRIDPRRSTAGHLDEILRVEFPHPGLRRQFEQAVRELIDEIAPLFDGRESIRIHGDAHAANLLNRPGEGFLLIDFDDMAVGPPVQDLWMMLPGHAGHVRAEIEMLLEGYEEFREFDRSSLRLIEPLRAIRFVHFTAWCARQRADGGFARLAPDWGSAAYWRQELQDLERQRQEIRDALDA